MGKEMILISSGFLIPSNRLFTVVTKDSTYRNSILGKKNGTNNDNVLSSLIQSGSLSSSAVCNDLYTTYLHNPNYETYMTLVDTLAEVFGDISLSDFVMHQARNVYLSPIGFKLCTDLLSDKLFKTYKEYLVAPSFFRVTNPQAVSPEEINRRVTEVQRLLTNNRSTFIEFLSVAMNDKGSIPAFFQYTLTDSNRGGLYG